MMNQSKIDEAFHIFDKLMEKLEKIPLTTKEREECKERFGEIQCSIAKNNRGEFFAYTHRARTKFYPSIAALPKEKVRFISSTS
jgi:uncharacterized protein YgiB involved in biofilm formation